MLYVNGRFLTQDITGVQRFALEISKRLALLRDDVTFLVPDINAVKSKEIISKFRIKEISGFNGHLWEQFSLPRFLNGNGSPLLLNLCNTAPAFYKNQIISHHDITYIKYPESFSFKFRVFYKLLASCIIKNSKSILTVSEFSKHEIVEQFKCSPSKLNVISNAANSEFKPNQSIFDKKDNYILAVSSPAFHKNFHGLIKAFIDYNIDIELRIIGAATGNFSKLHATHSNKIKFLGRVTDEELLSLYQNATAFIFPSLYEGFGIPPLEAQACGCPVLSSDRASMKEVLNKSALFFNPDSQEEIALAINNILYDDALKEKLIANGFENIKRFSWADSAQRINNIISNILKQ